MGVGLSLLAALALVAANACFVAVEFSLVAVDRRQLDLDAARGDRRASLVARVIGRLSLHLSGSQLGITASSVLLGVVAEPAVAVPLRPVLERFVSDGSARVASFVVALALAVVV